MSNEELAKSRVLHKKLIDEVTASPQKALAFLVEAGILTPAGELTTPYRQDA